MSQIYLQYLCNELPGRRTGSAGNHLAVQSFQQKLASFGFEIETPEFECMDWVQHGANLRVCGAEFNVFPSPYSLGCLVSGRLVSASSLIELEVLSNKAAARDCILLLRGELTKEQLMPKNFTFYNPDAHKEIYRLVESAAPLAVITATTFDLSLAGGIYPFPLFEDGDFDIPSVYMTEGEGALLASQVGETVELEIRAQRTPSSGCNVVARKYGSTPGKQSQPRITLMAHIDAKDGSPGALDNASGIATLLLLGEKLATYSGELLIEIVAINGEDYYASSGELRYLKDNADHFDGLLLGINLDGLGYIEGQTAYSLYECPPYLASAIQETFASFPGLVEGEPWYQGDHAMFLMNNRPALALTSEQIQEVMRLAHTCGDTPEVVDPQKLEQTALALHALLLRLSSSFNTDSTLAN
jgi:aminopeptidase YwaD